MSSSDELRAERLKKLAELRDAGVEGYPVESNCERTIEAFLAAFDAFAEAPTTLAGRVMSLRKQGGIFFADIFDGTARVQIVLQKTEMDETAFDLFDRTVDQGDFVEVAGVSITTKRGARSLQAKTWRMLSKSLTALPDEWFGIKDQETRLRERYLDILLDPELRAMFVRRSAFWQSIREFLLARAFLEVETPILENSPGGADARPFVTHHNALDIDVYLRISAGELWQKRLLVAGFPKVFEIGRIFRNEGQSNEHLQDYTQMELYEAYSDYTRGMQMIQELYRHVATKVYGRQTFTIRGHEVDLSKDWTVIDYGTIIKHHFDIDPIHCTDEEAIAAAAKAGVDVGSGANKARAVDLLWKSIRKTLAGPAFLVGIPVYLEPLAKRSTKNSDIVERFQVILAGSEVGKGFSELNDPIDQAQRFEAQQALRDAGDDEAQRLDQDYVRAMEYGMPPAFGFGVSERLFAFLEDKPAHETQLFPLLRPKQSRTPPQADGV